MFIVGLISGAVSTLAPLRLSRLGVSVPAIGAILIAGAAFGVAAAPFIGRLADRLGSRRIARVLVLLVSASVCLLALPGTVLAVCALASVRTCTYLTGIVGYTSAAEKSGASLGPGMGLGLSAWAAGAIVGPILAGTIADAASSSIALIVIAALALPAARLVAPLKPVSYAA